MSIAFKLGQSIGFAAATVVHGTRVGSTQLVAGTQDGYKSRADELLAKRQALMAAAKAAPTKVEVEVVDAPRTRRARAA